MTTHPSTSTRIVVFSGGVGGAKFAAGLHAVLQPGELTAIVNTADDFDHLGLRICPDLDSVLYALANVQDETRGWGRRNETWSCLTALSEMGADDWFALGDRDLAVHLLRSHSLRQGKSLADITSQLAASLGVHARILPMTESKVGTMLATNEGELCLQDYFVRKRCRPKVQSLRYAGIEQALLQPHARAALESPDLQAILIAPSNPFLSIDPILGLPGVKEMLEHRRVPVIAVSPLIGGKALKGPLADMLDSMGMPRTAATIAHHYAGLIDGLVIDAADAHEAEQLDLPVLAVPTLMTDAESREALARHALEFVAEFSNV